MSLSLIAAAFLLAAPDAAAASPPAAEDSKSKSKAVRTCYTAKPSGSRLSRRVCVTEAAPAEPKDEAAAAPAVKTADAK